MVSLTGRFAALALTMVTLLGLSASSALAATNWSTGNRVIGIRTYADGRLNVILERTLPKCDADGSRDRLDVVNVPSGAGTDRVYSAVMAALLSKKTVDIEYEDVRSGLYCEAIYFKINAE